MKELIKDLFLYHYNTNENILDAMSDYSETLPEELLDLFSHSINAHQIWNARIMGRKGLDVFQRHSFQHCKDWNKQNYFDTVDIIETKNLENIISYNNSKGEKFNNTVLQILMHVANHYSHHRGQLVRAMRKANIEPPVTDYIFYAR